MHPAGSGGGGGGGGEGGREGEYALISFLKWDLLSEALHKWKTDNWVINNIVVKSIFMIFKIISNKTYFFLLYISVHEHVT